MRRSASTVAAVARLPRYVFPDGVYHVVTRGVAQTAVFLDDDDRRFFLGLLGAVTSRNDGSSTRSA